MCSHRISKRGHAQHGNIALPDKYCTGVIEVVGNFMCFPIINCVNNKHFILTFFACLSVGKDVSLSQQLDECNNNVPDGVAVVLPSAPHSKMSSNSSSPSQSLRSSLSSSPLSPSISSASSSSDGVSLYVNIWQSFKYLQIFGLNCFSNFLTKVTCAHPFFGAMGWDVICFVFALGLWWNAVQNIQAAGRPGLQRPQRKVCHCQ